MHLTMYIKDNFRIKSFLLPGQKSLMGYSDNTLTISNNEGSVTFVIDDDVLDKFIDKLKKKLDDKIILNINRNGESK